MKLSQKDIIEEPIRGEFYSVERLEDYAAYLGDQLKITDSKRLSRPLLARMQDNGEKLLNSYRELTYAVNKKETITPAGEWLVDNFHIIEEQLREIQQDLPPSYYKELPKLALGELAGYPRIYALALALVAHTDSKLETATLLRFVKSFQKASPLNMGELWAVAITLRLVLVENLRRLSLRIIWDRKKRADANSLADQLIEKAGGDKEEFQKLVAKIPLEIGDSVNLDCAYIAQLVKRLRDQEPDVWPAYDCLEKAVAQRKHNTEQVVNIEHQHQAANQITVANIITSMRLISSIDWKEFFEAVSLVDRVLETDPADIYSKMAFTTRDIYRHVIERIAKRTQTPELAIAKRAIELAQAAKESKKDIRFYHIGYYLLVDKDVSDLEKIFHYQPKLRERILRSILRRPTFSYLGLFSFLTLAILAVPLIYTQHQSVSPWMLFAVLVLAAIPSSDLALSFLNLTLTNFIRPRRLPRMNFSKGIPATARTMVVIPCLFPDVKTASDMIEKLEVHFLGNRDEQLYFAILSDFTDSQTETHPEDHLILQAAQEGIAELNRRYGDDRFFVFHRKRLWNPEEKIWMGWERKRGKVQEFNHLLRGATNTSYQNPPASEKFLTTIRYVLTLDADTQLPRDCAKKLVATLAHPLNQAQFDKTLGRVTEGYGILQPRVGISLESSSRSFFAQIFSGYTGIDPYTTAVSDVYQDVFAEGVYTGKGLYDVDAFEAALNNRVPVNTVLSHDLFEGLFARTGLVTDVELLDDYPKTYDSFYKRQHRWIRGDWQILRWLFSWVPTEDGQKVKNLLPLISKWKIFDNLRRSLVSPALYAFLVAGWTFLPGSAWVWTGFGFLVVAFPSISNAVNSIIFIPSGTQWRNGLLNALVNARINLIQASLSLVFLAHQAYTQTDAVVRALYRSAISKQKRLEWMTAAQAESQSFISRQALWQTPWPTELLLGATIVAVALAQKINILSVAPVLLIWIFYPKIATRVSNRVDKKDFALTENDENTLRTVARRIWHFFETFVTEGDNWIPPDNYQEDPQPVIAHRTSPTNIGLYGLSVISAHDFGYITSRGLVTRLRNTLNTMEKLERYEGHYYNWYDTQKLLPLEPKYISTVDSGNLAGYLLALKQTCSEVPKLSIIDSKLVSGLLDTLLTSKEEAEQLKHAKTENGIIPPQKVIEEIQKAQKVLDLNFEKTYSNWYSLLIFLKQCFSDVRDLNRSVEQREGTPQKNNLKGWMDATLSQIDEIQNDILSFAPWVEAPHDHIGTTLAKYSTEFSERFCSILEVLEETFVLGDLPSAYVGAVMGFESLRDDLRKQEDLALKSLSASIQDLIDAIKNADQVINELLNQTLVMGSTFDRLFEEMSFKFLFDKERGVFSIGYNVVDGRLDLSFYDLLASECRLTSFVAIAKGDVPKDHWFRLGRQLVPVKEGRALISWTASMFEYLLPVIVMKHYKNTLLDETIKTVVARQISYGGEHGVPWGVSEAGYNARDLNLNYQYGPFGIPGLGLKRGLSHDLVVSPYSTLMATMIDPEAALENIHQLIKRNILTTFGFYESIDYTPERLPEKQKFAVIKSFMAHHQGMGFISIGNLLFHNVMQNRFHAEPRVRATQLLLQERIPQRIALAPPRAAEIEMHNDAQKASNPYIHYYNDPNLPSPRIQLLSNGKYSSMISTAGSGYSKCGKVAVTRWREDATRDNWGSYVFIKDVEQKEVWSTTYQPTLVEADSYKVTFGEDKAEFLRRDQDILARTEIIVAPEDSVEIRHVTLTNQSSRQRTLELTSYMEVALASFDDDAAHPAFSKLFIQTEFVPSKNALLAKRRPREQGKPELWALHVIAGDEKVTSTVQFETDRNNFIGRGSNLRQPAVMTNDGPLSNTTGAVLDPIFSLRVTVTLDPGETTRVAFTTGYAESRDDTLRMVDRYHDVNAFERESKIAWTKSQVELRHLGLDAEAAYLFQRLAARLLFPDSSVRPPSHQLAMNTQVQSSLWRYGISGDLPILVISVSNQKDVVLVRKLLRGHEYLRLKGLIYDFVILNDNSTSYQQDVQADLQQQIKVSGAQGWMNKPGGIFILRLDIMPEKDRTLIQSLARVSITADRDSLKNQIDRKLPEEKFPAVLSPTGRIHKYTGKRESVQNLTFFNDLGGFTPDGREYVITLNSGQTTPAPWLNVIANSRDFGFQVSESGSGYTWSVNSRENRLTPWSNDPVSDPSGEIIYLRDEDSGEVWTPTPLPVRDDSPYTIRHGHGYTSFEHLSHGLLQTLTMFVPKEDSIKISRLVIENTSTRERRISVTSYTEWVLGLNREKTVPYVVSEMDQGSGAIFSRNPYNNEFSERIAFSDISEIDRTFTCDRKEFLGRNGNYESPAALKRMGLSKKRGIGQDPCAVLQTVIKLKPGEKKEIIILLGQSDNADNARKLTLRYRDAAVVQKAFDEITSFWEQTLSTIQVKTPELSLDMVLNRWMIYQTIVCRLWARSAFYQSGGAYGFRDQLQDCLSLVYSAPQLVREHLIRVSKRQFVEGDVQHWWHPPTGRGVRTHISDDLLWLPFVMCFYAHTTQDNTIWDEVTPFLEAALLKPDQEDSYTTPAVSKEESSLYDHCIRAINHSLVVGSHGLPLMGTGDWNDGMNRVGQHGKGESVWMGWFLYKVLNDFIPYCTARGDTENAKKYQDHLGNLKKSLEDNAWDGAWYKRAYFDDGTPLGSRENEECKIDSLPQSWAVLSGGGDPVRRMQAMEKVSENLIKENDHLIQLFTPPFDRSPLDPGYIKGYVPGVRENGGQYTHAAVWVTMAWASLGNGTKALQLFNMLNPITHTLDKTRIARYKTEPYVIVADVYGMGSLVGRGGWTWYTGSASWFYRAGLESILGFNLKGEELELTPCIPEAWKEYEISYKHKTSQYQIKVLNPEGLSQGKVIFGENGTAQTKIDLKNDGKSYQIVGTLRKNETSMTNKATDAAGIKTEPAKEVQPR